ARRIQQVDDRPQHFGRTQTVRPICTPTSAAHRASTARWAVSRSNVIRVRSPLMIRTYPGTEGTAPTARTQNPWSAPRRGRALVFVVVLLVLAAVGRRPGAGIEPGAGRETVGFPGRGGLDARGGVLVHLGVPAHDLYLPSDQPIAPADPPRLKM